MCVVKFLSNLLFNNVFYKMSFSWCLENCLILVWLGIHGLSCRMGYIMPSYTIKKDFRDNLGMPIWSKQMLTVEFIIVEIIESLRLKQWEKLIVLNILSFRILLTSCVHEVYMKYKRILYFIILWFLFISHKSFAFYLGNTLNITHSEYRKCPYPQKNKIWRHLITTSLKKRCWLYISRFCISSIHRYILCFISYFFLTVKQTPWW